eukprot:TRINITY_DN635_c0_g1_i1.p1 TRINITY_DN635_c0_g1~~TRINITY_DN635_c0_g1_i1.p1  ORF type:complete len:322 (-),score=140.30 TRINITY_DN635_c0_g1_i1:790-1686(-)
MDDTRAQAEDFKEQGNRAFREQSYHSAIDSYTKAVDLCPNEPIYLNNRATASFQLNRFQSSLDDSRTVLEMDPKNIKAYIRSAKCYVRLGDYKKAREAFQKGIALDSQPNNPNFKEIRLLEELEGYEKRAKACLEQNDPNAANMLIDKVLQESFKSVSVRTLKIKALIAKKDYLEAANLAGELLRENEDNPEVIFLRGKAHFFTGNFESAIKHYIRALHMEPDLPGAGAELKKVRQMEAKKKQANEAFSGKRYEDAYNLYSELLAIDQTNDSFNSTIYCNRAAAAMQIGFDSMPAGVD